MPDWTNEQKKAIGAYGRPVIVSAAAGSGKTAVLVERTIRLLCDENLKIPADALLAVTFTNDAASQMRQKLSDAFEEKALEYPENAWIQKQQSLIRLADICTINSFCFDMVRNNLSESGFQSGVRIMDENESGVITDRALTDVFEAEYQNHPEDMERLISVFCRENDETLREMVLKLYKFLRSLPFRKQWTDSVLSSLADGSQLEKTMSELKNIASENLDTLKLLSDRLRDCADSLECHKSAREVFYKNCDLADDLVTVPDHCSWDECYEKFNNINWLDLRSARQSKAEKLDCTEEENLVYETAKGCLANLKSTAAEISKIFSCTEAEANKAEKATFECFSLLTRLCDELCDEILRIKKERNALDFADTELITVELLVKCSPGGTLERTALAEEIRSSGKYKIILIDEFQDVNNLQEVIFKAVSDTDNLSEIGKNVFAVGDVKQAIYRFRQANPMIFMNTRLQGQNPDSPVEEILLTRNFRSRKSILDFSNYIFSSLMTKETGEVDYTESEELKYGASYEGGDIPCEIIAINSDADDDGEVPGEFEAAARKISRMLCDKVPVKDGDRVRPCRPSDFLVLTRNNVSGDELSESFAAEGLKIQSSGVSGYLNSREISLLINLLTIIISPMRDIPMASVMLSPVMGFTDDELALVKLHNKDSRLYKNILELSAGEGKLSEKCASAVSLVKKLRVYSSSLSLAELVKKIYDVTDLLALAAAYEDGKRKCANLYLMLEYARSYEESSGDGLSGFIRYIDYIRKNGGDFAEALTVFESEDSVNVKTIHKSKGLEYPFVFICRLSKKFNKRDLYGRLALNAEGGVGFSFLDYNTLTKRQTVFADCVQRKNLSEMLSEELRLLYVAMTRAKEGLFIVMNIGSKTAEQAAVLASEIGSHKVPSPLIKRAVCMQDWLLAAMIKHPDFTCIRELLPFEAYKDEGELPKITVSEPLLPQRSAPDFSDVVVKTADSNLRDRIIKSFEYKNNSKLTETEAKVSVSELAGDDPLSFFPNVPRLDETIGELSAAQKGTLMHKFMQTADYFSAAKNLENEISALEEKGIFTEAEARSLDRKGLSGFFESDIYKRIAESENVMREKSFIVRFCDIDLPDETIKESYAGTDGMLQGIADCIFEEPDGYVIVDYKTDRVKSLDELRLRYSKQLILYKASFDILLDKPVKSSYIYSMRLGRGTEISLCLSPKTDIKNIFYKSKEKA